MSKLNPPKYAPDAIATNRGWETPKGELLVSYKGLKDKIDATKKPAKKIVTPEPKVVKDVPEETSGEPDFSAMTKEELELWARENIDVELDRRKSKKALIAEIKENL